jgi:hypothetical protein
MKARAFHCRDEDGRIICTILINADGSVILYGDDPPEGAVFSED